MAKVKAKDKTPKVKLAKEYSQEEIIAAQNLKIVINTNKNRTLEETKSRDKALHVLWMILVYALITLGAIMVLIPFYWMLITSLKDPLEIRNTITYWPRDIVRGFQNYVTLFKGRHDMKTGEDGTQYFDPTGYQVSAFPFLRYLGNTLFVAVLSTLGTIVTTVLAAFAFSKLHFKGRDFMFALFIGTMMIPGEMMVITNYITVAKLGWLSSWAGVMTAMIVPFWTSVFYIYLLRQNFKQIPNELYYAAKVDGKSDWEFLWKVLVPLARPTLITIFILKVMGTWNSYVWPQLVAQANLEKWGLMTTGLRLYSPSYGGVTDQAILMAGTVVVTVPLLLLFVFFRKYIIRGVGRAGIKG